MNKPSTLLIAASLLAAPAFAATGIVFNQPVTYTQPVVYAAGVTYLHDVSFSATANSPTPVELEGIVVTPRHTYNASEWHRLQLAKRQAPRGLRLVRRSGHRELGWQGWLKSLITY